MNCKPGDLAFIVRSDFPENIGRIVRVVAASGNWTYASGTYFNWEVAVIGSPLTGNKDGRYVKDTAGIIPDSFLRPIRPEPERLPAPPQEVTA